MAMKTIDCIEGNLPHEISDLLVTLASNWGDDIEVSELKVERLRITKPVYRISWPTENAGSSRDVFARLYDTRVNFFFNREEENRTFDFMSRIGFGPLLLGKFSRGRVEEFIHARTLVAHDLRDTEISALIAAKVREFHQIDVPGPRDIVLWDRMRTWLSEAKRMCTVEIMEQFHLDELYDEINQLEYELSGEQEFGFCHNDLQYGNLMIDDKTKTLSIIDYDYASYNPVAFDIANHFCEMAANYHTKTPHIIDFTTYPGLEERHRFLRAYLSYGGHEPSESEIEELSEDVEKYTLTSHILWALWMITCSYVHSVNFDFFEHARQRLQQYWLKKPQLLGVSNQTRQKL